MQLSRRQFAGGTLALAASGALGTRAFAQITPALSPVDRAMAAIRDYAEAHRRWLNLPAITVGVTSPSGVASTVHLGLAQPDARTAVTGDTLFQIGSISKSFTAALLHQFAAEGRFALSDRISAILPGSWLPASSPISVQHLLDHVGGIPGDAPLFVEGGLWTAYAPGQHWHYSNTGYDLLGRLAEHVGGKPLDQLLAERLFAPLGMRQTRGAITADDRTLYAQGYEAADTGVPFVRGTPLAPAAWVNVTSAAGSIGSTAADMNLYLRSIADAAQGRGGMGLKPEAGRAYAGHAVPSDSPEMRYGNGLMHVVVDGRPYLHHTGGMVSFSSSFHVDTGNGIGAFASAPISAFVEYRPRRLTLFAVNAIAAAEAGGPIPEPPPLDNPVEKAADYVGRYGSGEQAFEIRGTDHLTIVANGAEAVLQPAGEDLFRTLHPAFRSFSMQFQRANGIVVAALWGPETLVREGASVPVPPSDPKLARLAGTYVNDSPWLGTIVVVERGGKLWGGTEAPLTPIGDNLWRVGEEDWTPERASFADFIDGRPQTFVFSGERFLRQAA